MTTMTKEGYWRERMGEDFPMPPRFGKEWDKRISPLLRSPSNAWQADEEAEAFFREWINRSCYTGSANMVGWLKKNFGSASLTVSMDNLTATVKGAISQFPIRSVIDERLEDLKADMDEMKGLLAQDSPDEPERVDLRPILRALEAEREARKAEREERDAERRLWEKRWKLAKIGGIAVCALLLLIAGLQIWDLAAAPVSDWR